MEPAQAITQLLVRWSEGNKDALDDLMPLVNDELHKLAHLYLRRERRDHTLQPTALVNEAYVRLVGQENLSWQNRTQFFGLTAKLMRNILVDHARQHKAAKRGGEQVRLSLSEADRIGGKADIDMIALDDALRDLESVYPEHCRIVELRFFGGLTIEETAEVIGISHATVEREWAFARAWLRHELERETNW